MNAMNVKRFARSWLAAFVAVVFACVAGAAAADIVSTEQTLQQSERERARDDAASGLKALGVAPEEARLRVDAMTAEEVQVVAARADTLAAGGEASKTDWIVILLGAIVVILLV
jgi:hypothetical protein